MAWILTAPSETPSSKGRLEAAGSCQAPPAPGSVSKCHPSTTKRAKGLQLHPGQNLIHSDHSCSLSNSSHCTASSPQSQPKCSPHLPLDCTQAPRLIKAHLYTVESPYSPTTSLPSLLKFCSKYNSPGVKAFGLRHLLALNRSRMGRRARLMVCDWQCIGSADQGYAEN